MRKILLGLSVIFLGIYFMSTRTQCDDRHWCDVTSLDDVVSLFALSVDDIARRTECSIEQAREDLATILAVDNAQRTYANTVKAFDRLVGRSNILAHTHVVSILEMVSPDKVIRDAAHASVETLQNFFVEEIGNNVALYRALTAYADGPMANEQLTDEKRYFIKETLDDFKRSGLDLPEDERAKVMALQKDLAKLSQQFESNIAQDNRTISVAREALAGLDDDFIKNLKQDDSGQYILGIDTPTYLNVMQNCTVEDTRRQLYLAFQNRAYPQNEQLLRDIFAKRAQLARLLGFATYADLDLDDQMVGSKERAHEFLDELVKRSSVKEQAEFDELVKNLPDGIVLTDDGTIKPWDGAFIKARYKKKTFAIDERKIAEYFPMEPTVEGLLDIYHQFLGVDFKQLPVSGVWHDEVRCIAVYESGSEQPAGYLLLDLHPRDNKYSHACHADVTPAVIETDGSQPPSVSVVIANFPKATADKPSLLTRHDVNTFFHEFGHALHSLLGRTKVFAFSGTNVKRDFVEMPSQMLEEWLWDAGILTTISRHYETGQPLPDELIANIQKLKHFDPGFFVVRQAGLAKLALAYHERVTDDLHGVMQDIFSSTVRNYAFEPAGHMYTSFGHLTGYGAKYYGYLWSKVFALDLFAEIQKHGLLNADIGKKYIETVIGRGGSQDPNELLVAFLGREPRQDAFFKDLGI